MGQFVGSGLFFDRNKLTLQEERQLLWGDFDHFSSWADADDELLRDAVEELLWEGEDGRLLLICHVFGDVACAC